MPVYSWIVPVRVLAYCCWHCKPFALAFIGKAGQVACSPGPARVCADFLSSILIVRLSVSYLICICKSFSFGILPDGLDIVGMLC